MLLVGAKGAAGDTVIDYLERPPAGDGMTILDLRPADRCSSGSFAGARCLPVTDVLGPHRRLAGFSGILWLLGSAGLDGSERVLIIGDRPADREFMAGLLYLAGQRRISILTTAASNAAGSSPGTPRGRTRERIWQAPVRADRILLRSELATRLASARPPVLIDGRSEAEYWGERIRALRGGHLPGAQHLPLSPPGGAGAVSFGPEAFGGAPVAYAHDSYEGLVYLSRLVALGVDARLYLEGWVGWASDGALPVDSLSFPSVPGAAAVVRAADPGSPRRMWLPWLAVVLAGPLLLLLVFQAGRRWRR
ncbi:MAG TPA: hypothetical protein ENI96_06785 [Sedimenticola thiotaurini]|uniref:Rhodanese domain-containing protein n=1 Tax=Sedimenticola thiotaurini TaxID=1543721 RepID=A0A831RMC9_9GAMM|nr:hypothetical protein [Sedimenticola thiotaurini]